MRKISLVRRHHWWLPNAVVLGAALARIVTAAVSGTQVSSGEFIFWVAIAAGWMLIQFLTELRARAMAKRRHGGSIT